ncbi:hypothetical protein [Bailinhaonella thermotolerans]|uniref:Uncharacterized protein n=1 Tax=Bailinhaonella thermotolerans TaxID=1070861 RepID=A0A3A4A2U5_9ACTN|nr:hypothetical protein [Bailinhaonella thermotolerans]RJL21030.1 hypothetical protein D5H75_38095 [Bailinhaonella thermotolerans]
MSTINPWLARAGLDLDALPGLPLVRLRGAGHRPPQRKLALWLALSDGTLRALLAWPVLVETVGFQVRGEPLVWLLGWYEEDELDPLDGWAEAYEDVPVLDPEGRRVQ